MALPFPQHQPDFSSDEGAFEQYWTTQQQLITAEHTFTKANEQLQSYKKDKTSRHVLRHVIHELHAVLETDPTHQEAHIALAQALFEFDATNVSLAIETCETALRLNPTSADAAFYLGLLYQHDRQWVPAIRHLNLALNQSTPFWAEARLALGMTQVKKAVVEPNAFKSLGLTFQGMVNYVAGVGLLPLTMANQALLKTSFMTDLSVYSIYYTAVGFSRLGCHAMAKSLFLLGARVHPNESVFFDLLGDHCLYDEQQPSEAIPFYQQALSVEPDNIQVMKKLGKAFVEEQHYTEAQAMFEHIIERDNHDFESLYNLAQVYIEQQAYMKALYYFKEAAKFRPRHPFVHSNMGYVLFKLDDMEGAIEEYKLALEFGTDNPWLSSVAQTVATIYYKVFRDGTNAVEHLQQALHYNPENKDALATLGDIYFEAGEYERALKAYRSVLHQDAANAECYSNIGYILWQMDCNDEAIDAYEAALKLDKDNEIAHNNLGVIYLDEHQQVEQSIPYFEKALSLKSDYTLAAFNLARAHEKLGLSTQAARFYSQALDLNRQNPELDEAEIQARLAQLFQS